MIIKIEYNKLNSSLEITKDDDVIVIINNDTVIDNAGTLSFEIALDVSDYQKQFEEIETHIDGNNN